ncbi:hypothetical protein HMPREF3036_02221 [Sutterella sp. KLE1602]|nr:hypothetical protein HMPREF3036_02221 [Sutterella sp. KLE1602]
MQGSTGVSSGRTRRPFPPENGGRNAGGQAGIKENNKSTR